jgi:GNAT superfamily N-acetyltransferase
MIEGLHDRGMISRLTPNDIPRILELSSEAGWNQTPEDWRLLIDISPDLCFGIECNNQLAATATLVCYGTRLAWLGMVLTRTEFRRRGFARALVSHILEAAGRLGIRTVKLDATAQGQPLYESLGFVAEQEIQRWSGRGLGSESGTNDPSADRQRLKEFLVRRSQSPNDVEAESILHRKGLRASYLGPCLAHSRDSAAKLIQSVLAYDNGQWFWDLLPANSGAVELANRFGFTLDRRLIRMSRGAALREDESTIYAIAGFEFG